jgi:serine/threonine-protein kinase
VNALEPGSTLGGYRILARLRAGAMGVLYLARRMGHAGFSRPVAIKVIHDHLAANKRFCRMFIDEAKLSARIDDPNVVRVEEFGQADGRYYLVMEYVHGASLAQTIAVLRKRGGIPIDQAVAIAMQIAGGLHGAHEATDEEGSPLGIVHRDVSPHNVIVSYKGYVRVIDFGIAKAKQVGGQTKTGSLRGKLAYMPPEQARSARTVDRRADLYGVGLVLWEMLTFRRVFDADTDIAILNQIRNPEIVPPSTFAKAVPKALDDIVMRTLANEPDQRPATGVALQRALADAFPAALRVLAGDLAGLMKNVRAAADAAAGKGDDAASVYGEEVRGTLRTFGASMHEGLELADASDTRPSSPDLGELPAPPSASGATSAMPSGPPIKSAPPLPGAPSSRPPRMVTAQMVVEDEMTQKRTQKLPPSVLPLRPGDGVRPIPLPPQSSPDMLIPPPPLSSSRGLGPSSSPPSARSAPSAPPSLARPSYGDIVARPSAADAVTSTDVPPAESAGLTPKQKILLAVGAPVLAAMLIASFLVGGEVEGKRSAAAPPRDAPAKKAAVAPEPPPLIAPVVIAPPEPVVEDPADAGARTRPATRPRSSAGK